jgi:hypothetical protein
MNYLTLVIMLVAGLKLTIVQDKATTAFLSHDKDISQFVVSGVVRDQDNAPRPGLTVRAFDRNPGKDDILLGMATTNSQGNYSIGYSSQILDGKSSADLVIRVYQNDTLLHTSDIIFNAGQKVVKDFIIPISRSPDFQQLKNSVQPLLRKKSAPDGF